MSVDKLKYRTKLMHYVSIMGSLFLYALLPPAYIQNLFWLCRLMAISFIINLQFPTTWNTIGYWTYQPIFSLWTYLTQSYHHLTMVSLDMLFAYQSIANWLQEKIQPSYQRHVIVGICLLMLCVPFSYISLTQLLAVYILSLFSYQLSNMLVKMGVNTLGRDHTLNIDPREDQKQYLSELNIAQMKLVTMLLISIVTFMPITYVQGVCLFVVLPFCTPPLMYVLRGAVLGVYNRLIAVSYPQGLLRKDLEAGVGAVASLVLLVNYKYEHMILNFLLTLYSSVLLGSVASHFYAGIDEELVTSGHKMMGLAYNKDLIMGFWSLMLMYEITSLVYVPRLMFIIIGFCVGVDINYPFKYLQSLSRRLYIPKPSFVTVEALSHICVMKIPRFLIKDNSHSHKETVSDKVPVNS